MGYRLELGTVRDVCERCVVGHGCWSSLSMGARYLCAVASVEARLARKTSVLHSLAVRERMTTNTAARVPSTPETWESGSLGGPVMQGSPLTSCRSRVAMPIAISYSPSFPSRMRAPCNAVTATASRTYACPGITSTELLIVRVRLPRPVNMNHLPTNHNRTAGRAGVRSRYAQILVGIRASLIVASGGTSHRQTTKQTAMPFVMAER